MLMQVPTWVTSEMRLTHRNADPMHPPRKYEAQPVQYHPAQRAQQLAAQRAQQQAPKLAQQQAAAAAAPFLAAATSSDPGPKKQSTKAKEVGKKVKGKGKGKGAGQLDKQGTMQLVAGARRAAGWAVQ